MSPGSSDVWVYQQNAARLKLLGGVTAAVGLVFVVLARQAHGLSATTHNAALILGGLLLVTGAAVLILNRAQTVTVDPNRRWVRIDTSHRFGSEQSVALFRDIAGAGIGEIGDVEGGSVSYFVQLHLKNGKKVHLFVGWSPEQWNKAEMEARLRRLATHLGGPDQS